MVAEPPAVVAVRVQEEQQMEPLPLGWLCLQFCPKGRVKQGWKSSCGTFDCFAIANSDMSGLSFVFVFLPAVLSLSTPTE